VTRGLPRVQHKALRSDVGVDIEEVSSLVSWSFRLEGKAYMLGMAAEVSLYRKTN